MASVKLNVNLQVGRKVFPAGIYREPYPTEIIAEIEADSRHISEVELPNIKQPTLNKSGESAADTSGESAADKSGESAADKPARTTRKVANKTSSPAK